MYIHMRAYTHIRKHIHVYAESHDAHNKAVTRSRNISRQIM